MQQVNPVLVPGRKLSDGMVIPGIGMGTFGNDRYSSGEVSDAVYGAIKAGYRLFDCAAAYGNEKEIGQVFQKAFADGIVQREDLTIMTKVWNDRHGEGDVVTFELPALKEIAAAHHCHPATICVKWAMQRGQIPIPFSIYEKEYVENLKCVTEDFLTDEEMERLRKADQNARLIKGKVFLWEEAEDWRDIWDGEDAWNIL